MKYRLIGPDAGARRWNARVLIVAFIVAVGTTVGIRALHSHAERLRDEQVILCQLQTLVTAEESDQWEVMAKHGISPELAAEERGFDVQSDARIRALEALEGPSEQIATVRRAYSLCEAILDREAALVASGQYSQAVALDADQADAAFDNMNRLTRDLGDRLGAAARRAGIVAEWWSALVLLMAVSALVFFQRFAHARYAAAVLEAETRSIRASEDRLSRIVETNADAILLLDPAGRVTLANAAAERILGVRREEVLHKPCDDILSISHLDGTPLPDDRRPFQSVMASSAEVLGLEFVVASANGARVILSCNASPLHEAGEDTAGVVISMTDITERKTLEERLTHQAFHDPLTGLPNRALFIDRLTKAVDRIERTTNPVAVLFLDMDNFKLINDSLGHAMGDQLLVAVARRLQRCLRGGDTASRFGGDEFTVLLDGVKDTDAALEIAGRLSDELRVPFGLGTHEVVVTPSIGIAVTGLGTGTTDELLRNADAAMYAAKTHGKSRTTLFDISMNAHSLHRLEMENDLRLAVERNELVVHYQPEIAIDSGQILGVEALVRWEHPIRGLIQPTDFISLAEETGLIIPIGLWVLREACRRTAEWQRLYPQTPALGVAVNLSAKQFQDPQLLPSVKGVLLETGLDPRCLTLEITESVVMDEAESTIGTLRALKDQGVQLAIDDFGTGYSSLAYLKRFPMDFVKIHRSFISGLGRDSEDMLIVSATISLAHALGLAVVAEGTENEDQVSALRGFGCDIAQGYCFSRPLTGEQAEAFLRNHSAADAAVTVGVESKTPPLWTGPVS